MKVLYHYTSAGNKVTNNDACLHSNLYFHIQFHRKKTVITCCEFKKVKILKGNYCYICVIMLKVITMLYPMSLIFHNEVHLVRFGQV